MEAKNGRVYKSTGSFYIVRDEEGKKWHCRIRGKFKTDTDISSTNPIAVGDIVSFIADKENKDEDYGVITTIAARENYMVRSSPHNRYQKHIVAANIDQAVLIATINNPRTSFGFIDRFLLSAEAYHIPAIIVFNKSDQLKGKSLEEWKLKKYIYESAGYPTLTLSAVQGEGIEELKQVLQGKTTLFSGHSGVGKSTLINCCTPEQNLRVQEVSDWSGKGQHTTTFAEMMDLPFGGRIIDTPGVKEFGIVDISPQELSHYFPEMRARIQECKFNNCIHINEPECAVKAAVERDEISIVRYDSYIGILESL